MRFLVRVNGVEIEREWRWERIAEVKERLKRMGFRWTGDGWTGEVGDLHAALVLKGLLELDGEEWRRLLASLASVGGGAVVVVGDLPEELRPAALSSEGSTHVLSLSGYIRRFVAEDPSVARFPSFEAYVEAAVERLRGLLAGLEVLGDLDRALAEAREFALASGRLREVYARRREWRRALVGPNHAQVRFLASGLLRRLAEFRLPYNVVDREGNISTRQIRLVRVERAGEGHRIAFPAFLRDRVAEVLRELGYLVEEVEVSYPRVDYRPSYSLFPFQREAVDNWQAHGMRGTVVIPTGGGKTFVGLEAMARASTSALVLVVTRELALQWAERIRRFLGVPPGLLGGGEHDVRDVTVAIYNSAVKYLEELRGRFGLAIFDEAHHVPAETFKEVALGLDTPRRLALSATPEREDRNEHLIYEAVGPPVYRASYRAMVEAGLVVPVEHYRIYVRLTPDEEREYRALEARDNPILLRNFAARAAAKVPAVVRIVEGERGKVLVFTQLVEQAEAIYQELRRAGVKAELITSEEGGREAALRRFAAGLSRVVVTTTVLDEGVDVPDADVAVVASGTGSLRQMVQRVGRVVRAAPGKRVARVYELVARGTIEEALSEARHFDRVIEEAACRRLAERDLDRASLQRWL